MDSNQNVMADEHIDLRWHHASFIGLLHRNMDDEKHVRRVRLHLRLDGRLPNLRNIQSMEVEVILEESHILIIWICHIDPAELLGDNFPPHESKHSALPRSHTTASFKPQRRLKWYASDMERRPMRRLWVLAGAVAFLGVGCARQAAPPEPPPLGGIYRSDDGGVTFTQKVTLPRRQLEILGRNAISNLAQLTPRQVIIPNAEPETLYVVAAEGVYRSTTAGDTWERLIVPAREVFSLSVHPRNPNILLSAATSVFGTRGKILKSLTRAVVWSDTFTAPTSAGETGTLLRRRRDIPTQITVVAHDSLAPQVVFAGTNTGVLLVSTDGGVRWKTRNAFHQGITGLEISPTVPGRMLLRLADGRLVHSSDGGITVNRSLIGKDANELSGLVATEKPEVTHAVLFERPTNNGIETILAGTESGLFRSLDGGATWTQLPLPPSGIPSGTVDTPVRSLAQSADGRLWATSGFVLLSSADGGTTWRASDTIIPQQIRFVVTDPVNPQRLYLFFTQS